MKNRIQPEQTADRATSRRAADGKARTRDGNIQRPHVIVTAATGDRSRSGDEPEKPICPALTESIRATDSKCSKSTNKPKGIK
jgi:hypothetical protein